MAKDNLSLLNEISSQLKKLNQDNVRQRLEDQTYREKELAKKEGKANNVQEPQFIDAGEDLKRRLKANLIGAKVAEKFTDSGKRAKIWLKDQKKPNVILKDKRVGLFDIIKTGKDTWEAVEKLAENTELKNMPTWFGDTNTTLALIKVNSDKMISQFSGIRHVLGMKQVSDTAQFKKVNEAAKNEKDQFKKINVAAANEKRTKEEEKRERADAVKKMGKLSVFMKEGPKSATGGSLFSMMLFGLIAGVAMAVKNMIDGWKIGGFGGLLKNLFFGSGEGGIGNAIAKAFTIGGTFAMAGLLIGGPVGALVGGLIGMVVGAITGFIGKDKLDSMMAGAGETFGKGIDNVQATLLKWSNAIGRWIYTPGTAGDPVHGAAIPATMFGGTVSLKMPKFVSDIGDAIAGIWDGLMNFKTAIKNSIIRIMPDWFTDKMGWTKDGKIPTKVEIKNPWEETGGNTFKEVVEAQILENTKDTVSAYELAMQNYATEGMNDLPPPDYADYMKIGLGSPHMGNWLDFVMAPENENIGQAELAAKHKIAFPANYSDKVLKQDKVLIAEAEAKKKAEEAKKLMLKKEALEKNLSKLDYKMMDKDSLIRQAGDGGGKFVNHTDASSNVGAVVVQNIYALDQPIGPALISIHDHFDNNQAYNLAQLPSN